MPMEEGEGRADAVDGAAAPKPPPAAAAAAIASPRASTSSNESADVPATELPDLAKSTADSMPGGRTRRSSSVVVYPEQEDVGKPKMFARQSFIVSGEEEEMAETILKARQLAGQRRRSTIEIEDVSGKQGEIVALAQTLAARRDSVMNEPDGAAAAAAAATAAAAAAAAAAGSPAVAAAVTPDPAEQAAVARRRSSVLQRIPDNLRALVQQSDASGVQQKSAAPTTQGQDEGGTKDDLSSKKTKKNLIGNTQVSTASSNSTAAPTTQGQRWIQTVLAFIRWKGRGKKKRSAGRNEAGGGGKNKESGCTPFTSPTPGSHRKSRALLPPQLPMFAGRKQLILDLDETLVHSSFKPVSGADYVIDIDVDNTFYKVFVLKRPGVDEFLERMAKVYEVIVFTASLPQYANPLLDLLDPNGTITSRLFREHCTFHEGYFVKDLTLVRNQTLESTIIVDNSPMAYMFQPENAIDCISWIDEQDDTELYVIADFLEAILDVPLPFLVELPLEAELPLLLVLSLQAEISPMAE
eukprot:jgi/Undpi1/10418/HiC_scaffold_29.g12868.m1